MFSEAKGCSEPFLPNAALGTKDGKNTECRHRQKLSFLEALETNNSPPDFLETHHGATDSTRIGTALERKCRPGSKCFRLARNFLPVFEDRYLGELLPNGRGSAVANCKLSLVSATVMNTPEYVQEGEEPCLRPLLVCYLSLTLQVGLQAQRGCVFRAGNRETSL